MVATSNRQADVRILIANDDGIHAPGLLALVAALADVGDVTVVAPERERSAVSHAISLREPLRAWPMACGGATAWATNGTPADCVLLGARELLAEPPDVVVAGINRGANLGEDIWYSGTVAAAKEGALLGYPAVAFSVCCHDQPPLWQAAADYARRLVPVVAGLPAGTLLNVNVPNLPPEQVAGAVACRQGVRGYYTLIDRRVDPRGAVYYWIGTGEPLDEPLDGSDLAAIAAGCIAVTPVQLDLTDHAAVSALGEWLPPAI